MNTSEYEIGLFLVPHQDETIFLTRCDTDLIQVARAAKAVQMQGMKRTKHAEFRQRPLHPNSERGSFDL